LYLIFRLKPVLSAVYTIGFAGTALEVVILLSLQALYGFVYHMVGLIVAALMLGLAAGSHQLAKSKASGPRAMIILLLSVAAYSLILPVAITCAAFGNLAAYGQVPLEMAFCALTAVLGVIVGCAFPVANRINLARRADASASMGQTYATDLIGASFGAIVTASFLVPAIGILNVCFLTAFLNIISFVRFRWSN
jgi:spermidine synthase